MDQASDTHVVLVSSNTSESTLSMAMDGTTTNVVEGESVPNILLKEEESITATYDIDCICKIKADDGFTIQCEECLCWNHAKCVGIDKPNIPHRYLCHKCRSTSIPSGKKTKKPQYVSINDNIFESDTLDVIKLLTGAYEKLLFKMPQPWNDEKSYKRCNFKLCKEIVAFPNFDSMKNAFKLVDSRDPRRKGPPVLGRGLYVNEDVDPGTVICEYLGHWKSLFMSESQEQHQINTIEEGIVEFSREFFTLGLYPSTGLYIDTRKFGNVSRFIRRSCRPNCEIKFVITGDDLKDIHVCIFAAKFIQSGDELFISINFPDKELAYNTDCACGNPDFCLGPYPYAPTTVPLSSMSSVTAPSKSYHHYHTEKVAIAPVSSISPQPSSSIASSSSNNSTLKQGETKKLSREERKLQQYIEFFEKMENAEKSKHHRKSIVTTTPSIIQYPMANSNTHSLNIHKSSSGTITTHSKSKISPKVPNDAINDSESSSPVRTKRKYTMGQGRKKKTFPLKSSSIEYQQQQSSSPLADSSLEMGENSPSSSSPITSSKSHSSSPSSLPSSLSLHSSNKKIDNEKHKKDKKEQCEDYEKKEQKREIKEIQNSKSREMIIEDRCSIKSSSPFPIEVVNNNEDEDDKNAPFTPSIGDLSLNNSVIATASTGGGGTFNSQAETPTKKRVSLSDYLRKKKEEKETLLKMEDDQEDGELLLHENHHFEERRFSTPQPEKSHRSPDYEWKRSISYVNSPRESHNYHGGKRNYHSTHHQGNENFYYQKSHVLSFPSSSSSSSDHHYHYQQYQQQYYNGNSNKRDDYSYYNSGNNQSSLTFDSNPSFFPLPSSNGNGNNRHYQHQHQSHQYSTTIENNDILGIENSMGNGNNNNINTSNSNSNGHNYNHRSSFPQHFNNTNNDNNRYYHHQENDYNSSSSRKYNNNYNNHQVEDSISNNNRNHDHRNPNPNNAKYFYNNSSSNPFFNKKYFER